MTDANGDLAAELEYTKDLPGYERTHPHYFKDPVIDHMMEALFLLAGEVWTNRDRQAVIEKLLSTEGKVTTQMIEEFNPDEEFSQKLANDRKAYIRRVFKGFYGEDMLPGEGGFFDWFLKDR